MAKVNSKHFTDLPCGGHFTDWEEPELYAKDLQDSVRERAQRTDSASRVK